MTFKKTEKEILKAIVKYGDGKISLAEALNKSKMLEKRGIAIIPDNINRVFFKKTKYKEDDKEPWGFICEFVSLINYLIDNRLIVIIPFNEFTSLVLGKEKSEWGKNRMIIINDGEGYISPQNDYFDWFENGEQAYWPGHCSESLVSISKTLNSWFTVSQELRDLVDNNFKSEEQIRFEKQQLLTRVSIIVAIILGLLGIVF